MGRQSGAFPRTAAAAQQSEPEPGRSAGSTVAARRRAAPTWHDRDSRAGRTDRGRSPDTRRRCDGARDLRDRATDRIRPGSGRAAAARARRLVGAGWCDTPSGDRHRQRRRRLVLGERHSARLPRRRPGAGPRAGQEPDPHRRLALVSPAGGPAGEAHASRARARAGARAPHRGRSVDPRAIRPPALPGPAPGESWRRSRTPGGLRALRENCLRHRSARHARDRRSRAWP